MPRARRRRPTPSWSSPRTSSTPSPYLNGANQALATAVTASPSLIAGTSVHVQPIAGSNDWFVLRATGSLPYTYQESKPIWTMQKAGRTFDAQ